MSTLEQRRDTLVSLANEYVDELMDLVATMGGDPDYLASWAEKMAGDLHVAFSDAIEARDKRNSPTSKAIYHAEVEGRL